MNPLRETKLLMTRRHFFGRCGAGVGVAALASLLEESGLAQQTGLPGLPHFAPKAKRVIYLYQSGAPSQLDLFDPKPQLEKYRGQNLPDSIRRGQRLTGMTAYQSSFPTAPSVFKFERHGGGARGFPNCRRIRLDTSTTSASSSQCTPSR